MTESDLSRGNEEVGSPMRSFMTDGETMGICIILAKKMTETGKGIFIVKAPADNNIDPDTGCLYPNDQVRMIIEGQENFTPYNKALKEVLDVRKLILESFHDDFSAGMATTEEMEKQVNYFSLGIKI